MFEKQGRGEQATADMKARVAAGWSVSDLWDRFADPDGFTYEFVVAPNTSETPARA